MAAEAGSQPLQPVPGNLSEGSVELQRTLQVICLNCSEAQILELANVFSQHSIDQILRWAKVYSSRCESVEIIFHQSPYTRLPRQSSGSFPPGY
jgi:hypothetical protein